MVSQDADRGTEGTQPDESRSLATSAQQERRFWNDWNASAREHGQDGVPLDQARVVERWLSRRRDLSILEAGCGAGWMSERLAAYGDVLAIDIADEVVGRAQERAPHVRFAVGDLLTVDLGSGHDVVVSLEVLAHVADQQRLLSRFHAALKPGGELMLATQNKPVLANLNHIPPPAPGQLRRWVNRAELRQLAETAGFRVEEMFVKSPRANYGLMRVVAKAARMSRTARLVERFGFGWTIMLRAVAE